MKLGTATQASYDDRGFYVDITGKNCHISTTSLGTVIGWAKISQRKSGLTRFDINNALNGLYFEPTEEVPLKKLQKDLIALLESIGFETTGIAFTKSPSPLRRPTSQPAQTIAPEQSLAA